MIQIPEVIYIPILYVYILRVFQVWWFWFQALYSHFGAGFPLLKRRFYADQERVGEDIVKQAVFKPLTASSSEVNYNSGLGILLPTSPSANLHPQKHQAKNYHFLPGLQSMSNAA